MHKPTPIKNGLYLSIFIVAIMLMLYAILFSRTAIWDILLAWLFYAFLYFYDRKFNLSVAAFLLVAVAIILSPLGVFGLYSYFVIGVVGYDKLIHFVGGFALVYALSQNFLGKRKFISYVCIILIVLGLGAVNEINEFIGYRYFGIDNGGIFTIEDTLPVVKSDLQRYDTYFDMIFNLAGAVAAVLVVIVQKKYSRNRPKN